MRSKKTRLESRLDFFFPLIHIQILFSFVGTLYYYTNILNCTQVKYPSRLDFFFPLIIIQSLLFFCRNACSTTVNVLCMSVLKFVFGTPFWIFKHYGVSKFFRETMQRVKELVQFGGFSDCGYLQRTLAKQFHQMESRYLIVIPSFLFPTFDQ